MSELIERIKQNELPENQLKVVQAILDNIEESVFLSGQDICDRFDTSLSTLTRIAKSLQYKGFPEFKKATENYYKDKSSPSGQFSSFIDRSDRENVVMVSLKQDLENLSRMKEMIDLKDVKQFAKQVARSSRIILVGIGTTEVLVDKFALSLELLGLEVLKLQSFGISNRAKILELGKRDVVIIFSQQRIIAEIYDVLLLAKQTGAKTLSISDSSVNQIAVNTEVNLVAPMKGTCIPTSLTAPLALLNIIEGQIAALDKVSSMKRIEKMQNYWDRLPIFIN